MKLRPYQTKIIDQARALMNAGHKSMLIQAPTGSGKTLLTAFMLKSAMEKGIASWFVVHRRELIKQSIFAFSEIGVPHGVIANGWLEESKHLVQIASIQTLARRFERFKKPRLIVIDECFPSYIKVDGKNISDLQVGDTIRTHRGSGSIKNVFVRKVTKIIKLKFKSGKILVCTPNHPIATRNGFVPAISLTKNDMVVTIINHGMQNLWRYKSEQVMQENCLQVGVFKKNNYEYLQEIWRDNKIQKNKWDVEARNKGKSFFEIKSDEVETKNTGWKWKGADNSRNRFGCCFRLGLQCDSSNWFSPLFSNSLQNRRWKQPVESSYRNRRIFTCGFRKKRTRQEKREVFSFDRLESFEIHEQGNSFEFEQLCPEGLVYNLHVSNGNTYFAENILVHNCHHCPAGSWKKIMNAVPSAFRIGLTATPERLDGKGLESYFEKMIIGPSVKELINQGFLSPYKIFAPPSINTQGIKTMMGDFARNQLEKASDKPSITGNAIEHYLKHAKGKRAVVFCVSIEHSKHVVEQFNLAGIKAEHVDGETQMEVRDAAVQKFRNGEILVLSNVELFGEGFDLPQLECAILLRPTKSLCLYLQQVGRSLRPAGGKDSAVILDHAGNTERHGLPCEERSWSLRGYAGKQRSNTNGQRVKICPRCYATQAWEDKCRFCGYEFGKKERTVAHKEGDLIEIDQEKFKKLRRMEQGKCESYHDLLRLGKLRGYKRAHAWASYIMRARQARKLIRAAK